MQTQDPRVVKPSLYFQSMLLLLRLSLSLSSKIQKTPSRLGVTVETISLHMLVRKRRFLTVS